MNSPLSIIISREYLERVKRKSFIITTILMPILMVALMVIPAALAIFSQPEENKIAVVDNTGVIAERLHNTEEAAFVVSNLPVDSLKNNEDFDGVLILEQDLVENPSHASLYTRGPSGMALESAISDQLSRAIEDIRIQNYQIDNLKQIMKDVQADVKLSTFRLDREEGETSSMLSYGIGMAMSFILYMIILIYGQMVMTSIIEEKTNRVLEIVVSSVKPAYLMAGKIIGVGLVALTQILIWAVIIISFCTWALPSLLSSIPDSDVFGVLSQLGDAGFVTSLFVYMILFLIGGYLLYASIYAAIGSAVDNIQDAGQLQMVAVLPIILGFIFAPAVSSDPMSSIAFWTSIIPLTSPLVMMSRIPFGIPSWEIWLSIGLLYASFAGLIWLAAKIYRVGIFMYGKKPSLTQLIRWARYK